MRSQRLLFGLVCIVVLVSVGIARTSRPVPYEPIKNARCERVEYPAGKPLWGCYIDATRTKCMGECYIHQTTLYFGVCVDSQGSTCHPYQRLIRA